MSSSKRPSYLLLCVGLIAVVLSCLVRFVLINRSGSVKTEILSTLTDTINISELSTAEFSYKGIAEVYSNAEKTKIRCHICYKAIVKAGIDMKDVKIKDFDTSSKTISLSLPEISLKVIIVDEDSMNTLPSDESVSFDTMLMSCKEDAELEAKQSSELLNTARENLMATIEGLAYPILKPQGYTIVWE